MKPSRVAYRPSHPQLFEVQFNPGEYSSFLRALKSYEPGDYMVPFKGLTKAPKAYTSVQCSPSEHVELNSDLVYINHSCEPNVAFDLSSSKDPAQWHVRALKRIEAGDPLTFFYPSTEWDMDQPFDCQCGTKSCLRFIAGAAQLSMDQLEDRGFVNTWIKDLVVERDTKNPRTSASPPSDGSRSTTPSSIEKCTDCEYGFSVNGDAARCGCKNNSH